MGTLELPAKMTSTTRPKKNNPRKRRNRRPSEKKIESLQVKSSAGVGSEQQTRHTDERDASDLIRPALEAFTSLPLSEQLEIAWYSEDADEVYSWLQ